MKRRLKLASGDGGRESTNRWLNSKNKDLDARGKGDAMLEWLESNGMWVSELSGWNQAPHQLALATSTFDELEGEDSGRGLLARRQVVQDSVLITLPVRLCMTKQAALESKELKGCVKESTNEYIAIALLLISERAKGEDSTWCRYVDVLPTVEEVGPTFAWAEEDIANLEGSPVVNATRSMIAKLKAEHADAVASARPPLDASIFTFEAWEWAFCMLFSRAIRLKSGRKGELLALVPYVDFINHSPFSSAYVDAREVETMFWEPKMDEVVLFADRSYKKFEQVFISYGPKSNADLLLLYGFALDRNPFNSVCDFFTIPLDGVFFTKVSSYFNKTHHNRGRLPSSSRSFERTRAFQSRVPE